MSTHKIISGDCVTIMRSLDKESIDLVLDPLMGCGTTLLAAEETGRNSIGIDISTEYCKLAYKRINKIINQTKLSGEKSYITFISK